MKFLYINEINVIVLYSHLYNLTSMCLHTPEMKKWNRDCWYCRNPIISPLIGKIFQKLEKITQAWHFWIAKIHFQESQIKLFRVFIAHPSKFQNLQFSQGVLWNLIVEHSKNSVTWHNFLQSRDKINYRTQHLKNMI